MTCIDKLNRAEYLLDQKKKFGFLKPRYGFYATGLAFLLSFNGAYNIAFILAATSSIVSIIGIGILFYTGRCWRKAFRLIDEVSAEIDKNTCTDEAMEMLARQRRLLEKL